MSISPTAREAEDDDLPRGAFVEPLPVDPWLKK